MRQRILPKTLRALLALALIAIAGMAQAMPQAVTLIAHNQRSSSGTLSTLVWRDCGPTGTGPGGVFRAPCLNPTSPWVVQNGVTGSNVHWEWDSATWVLSSTGVFWTTSYIASGPSGSSVLSDRVENLRIDMINQVTEATNYRCIEGTFLVGVNSNGCGTYNLGFDGVNNSSVAYNVGGDPYCIHRTMGGDDQVTGNPRGVRNAAAGEHGAGCDATEGAMLLYTLVQDNLDAGGTLILSNGICIGTAQVEAACAGVNFMTFVPVPLPAVGWLLAPAFSVIGWLRRRRVAP